MKRERYKELVLQGRKWRISKFDALTGSFIAYKLLFQMLPMGLEQKMEGMNLPAGRSTMSKDEFIELQRDCLAVCAELKVLGDPESGGVEAPIPVVNSNGDWGVSGLEDDTMLVLTLTVHALIFNISGFFSEDALKELTSSFKDMKLFNAST